MTRLLLLAVCLATGGCLHSTPSKFDPKTGNVIQEGGFTAFLVRGSADSVKERFRHSSTNYDRQVSIGGLTGQTETDKLSAVAEAAAAGAVKGLVGRPVTPVDPATTNPVP